MDTPTPPLDPAGSVTLFFHQLQDGDPDAANGLWARYFPRLVGLARGTLARQPQRAADAEDAALSAFASFWRRAGDFSAVLNRDDLWKLLGTITVRKALRQARRETADKRGGGHVIGETALNRPDGSPLPLDEAVAGMPTADFDLHSAELLESLEPELRTIAVYRFLGHTNREIAELLGCTERKIERKLHIIRLQWETDWPTP
jgi:DNA-directed RNA polymerase specialized sigma24 family protein